MDQQQKALAARLAALSESSQRYANEASDLSRQILEFESLLNGLEGKDRVQIEIGGSDLLAFERSGDRWRLFFRRNASALAKPLTECSIDVKIRASYGFDRLLIELAEQHERKIAEITLAKMRIAEMGAVLTEAKKGGR